MNMLIQASYHILYIHALICVYIHTYIHTYIHIYIQYIHSIYMSTLASCWRRGWKYIRFQRTSSCVRHCSPPSPEHRDCSAAYPSTGLCMYVCMFVCIYVHIYVCLGIVHVCLEIDVYMYTCTFCMYVYVCIFVSVFFLLFVCYM